MKTWLTWLAAAVFCAGSSQPPANASLTAQIPGIEQELTAITGLRFSKPVRIRVMTRRHLNEYLSKEIHRNISPKELRGQEATLKLLGLVPADFSLEKATVELFTEQAAAFYDYHRKQLFVLPGDTGISEPVALAHELAHALADQNFRLDKYVGKASGGDDAAMARLAVMEGQASWLMAAWVAETSGRPVEEVLRMFEPDAAESKPERYPVYANAPLYMRESLVFPYSAGMQFENALYGHDRQSAFREPFVNPPVSTQQILHPDRYIRGDARPVLPEPPRLPDQRGYRLLTRGNLGEFDLRVILEQFGERKQAQEMSSHISGAAYSTWEGRKSGDPALAWAVNWDNRESALRFFRFYASVLERKAVPAHVEKKTADSISGENAAGGFHVQCIGRSMVAWEGLSAHVQ